LLTPQALSAALVPQTISYRIDDRLHLNITNSCTLECVFCPKSRSRYRFEGHDLFLERRPDAQEILRAIAAPERYAEVVFSGLGEPTLRLAVLMEVAQEIKAQGGRVRVVTDGLANLVHDRDVLPSMAAVVDALSVSLNAQDEATYERYCRPNLPGSFRAMLAFLREAPRRVPKVTATAIAGLEGVDLAACERLAREAGADFRTLTLVK
jgi:TatD family-associated radical SAM protein